MIIEAARFNKTCEVCGVTYSISFWGNRCPLRIRVSIERSCNIFYIYGLRKAKEDFYNKEYYMPFQFGDKKLKVSEEVKKLWEEGEKPKY